MESFLPKKPNQMGIYCMNQFLFRRHISKKDNDYKLRRMRLDFELLSFLVSSKIRLVDYTPHNSIPGSCFQKCTLYLLQNYQYP